MEKLSIDEEVKFEESPGSAALDSNDYKDYEAQYFGGSELLVGYYTIMKDENETERILYRSVQSATDMYNANAQKLTPAEGVKLLEVPNYSTYTPLKACVINVFNFEKNSVEQLPGGLYWNS